MNLHDSMNGISRRVLLDLKLSTAPVHGVYHANTPSAYWFRRIANLRGLGVRRGAGKQVR